MADVVSTRPLIDKLGVRPGARVALIDIEDAEFRRLLAERTHDITEGEPLTGSDLVFVGIDDGAGLGQLPFLREPDRPERRDLGRLAQGPRRPRSATWR